MEHVFANKTVGISELKANPSAVLSAAQSEPVAILNRNKPAGYLVSPAAWAAIFEKLDDAELASVALARLSDGHKPVKVTLDEL